MTSAETTASSMMMRILDGIWLRIIEMTRFENAVTTVRPTDITNAFSTFVVTASEEQTPRIWMVTGLFSESGSKMTFLILLSAMASTPALTAL